MNKGYIKMKDSWYGHHYLGQEHKEEEIVFGNTFTEYDGKHISEEIRIDFKSIDGDLYNTLQLSNLKLLENHKEIIEELSQHEVVSPEELVDILQENGYEDLTEHENKGDYIIMFANQEIEEVVAMDIYDYREEL